MCWAWRTCSWCKWLSPSTTLFSWPPKHWLAAITSVKLSALWQVNKCCPWTHCEFEAPDMVKTQTRKKNKKRFHLSTCHQNNFHKQYSKVDSIYWLLSWLYEIFSWLNEVSIWLYDFDSIILLVWKHSLLNAKPYLVCYPLVSLFRLNFSLLTWNVKI